MVINPIITIKEMQNCNTISDLFVNTSEKLDFEILFFKASADLTFETIQAG